MSTESPSQDSVGPLVEALRRKTKHQDQRIDDLEVTIEQLESVITSLESDVVTLKRKLAEVS